MSAGRPGRTFSMATISLSLSDLPEREGFQYHHFRYLALIPTAEVAHIPSPSQALRRATLTPFRDLITTSRVP